jgi:Toprim domain
MLGLMILVVLLDFSRFAASSRYAALRPTLLLRRGPRGSPIVLAPVNDLGGLAITEGIEDGLTVYEATGLGVWVAGAASFMPALADRMPPYVEAVTIYAHDDQAGQSGAGDLAERLIGRGLEVFVEQLR